MFGLPISPISIIGVFPCSNVANFKSITLILLKRQISQPFEQTGSSKKIGAQWRKRKQVTRFIENLRDIERECLMSVTANCLRITFKEQPLAIVEPQGLPRWLPWVSKLLLLESRMLNQVRQGEVRAHATKSRCVGSEGFSAHRLKPGR